MDCVKRLEFSICLEIPFDEEIDAEIVKEFTQHQANYIEFSLRGKLTCFERSMTLYNEDEYTR